MAYSKYQKVWTAVHQNKYSLLYSKDGIKWTQPLSTQIFNRANCIACNSSPTQTLWIAGSDIDVGYLNSLAYSVDAINWIIIQNSGSILNNVSCIEYSYFQNLWVAGGSNRGSKVCMCYSKNGFNWTSFTPQTVEPYPTVTTIKYEPVQDYWMMSYSLGFMYSKYGTKWTNISSIVVTNRTSIAYSASQQLWISGGYNNTVNGNGNSIVYSTDGFSWTGIGQLIYNLNTTQYCVCYNISQNIWVSGGTSTGNSLSYSTDGFSWTGIGTNIIASVYSVIYHERLISDYVAYQLFTTGKVSDTYTAS